MQVLEKPKEAEEEIKLEALPTVIYDSNYKVRLTKSAYKEMVGQPECYWLNSTLLSSATFFFIGEASAGKKTRT